MPTVTNKKCAQNHAQAIDKRPFKAIQFTGFFAETLCLLIYYLENKVNNVLIQLYKAPVTRKYEVIFKSECI